MKRFVWFGVFSIGIGLLFYCDSHMLLCGIGATLVAFAFCEGLYSVCNA